MNKKILSIVMILMLGVLLLFLTGCSKENGNNEQNVEVENALNESSGKTEENDVIQVGDYTLEYGTYIDKYGTKYILNKNGTYSCESTDPNLAGTGTYEIFYFESSMWEFDYPAGIDEGWYIGMNPDNNKKDSEKPWLFDNRYDVEENNIFYNAQTDEQWELE